MYINKKMVKIIVKVIIIKIKKIEKWLKNRKNSIAYSNIY